MSRPGAGSRARHNQRRRTAQHIHDCHEGKADFPTQRQAERVLDFFVKSGQLIGPVHVYQCPKCRQWFIGHYNPDKHPE